MKIGALEAGGTKMVLAVFDENARELERCTMPTRDPGETMPDMLDYFASRHVDALGIASFGPLDLNPGSETYGYITTTPKLAWQHTPLMPAFRDRLQIPVSIDTDVNAAAYAEYRMGAAKGAGSVVYITVGTGIGGGIVINGKMVHGLLHPEVGHMLLQPHPEDPLPQGICPFHQGCLEGLAAGPSLRARLGKDAGEAGDNDPVFELESHYLAQMCHNLIVTLSPEKIILGGGVMARSGLMDRIRQETLRLLNGYISVDTLKNDMEHYIISPMLYPVSGLVGAYLLGLEAAEKQ